MLPAGYPSGTCTPTTPKPNSIWVNAVAMVDCGQNTNPGGPSRAVYGLFANPDVLNKAFNDDIADVQLMNCPGEGQSPDSWHYDKTPTVTAGMVACATYKNQPNVIWSNQAKLMLSDVFGDPPAIDGSAQRGGRSTADLKAVADKRARSPPILTAVSQLRIARSTRALLSNR